MNPAVRVRAALTKAKEWLLPGTAEERMAKALEIALEALEHNKPQGCMSAQVKCHRCRAIERMADVLDGRE